MDSLISEITETFELFDTDDEKSVPIVLLSDEDFRVLDVGDREDIAVKNPDGLFEGVADKLLIFVAVCDTAEDVGPE